MLHVLPSVCILMAFDDDSEGWAPGFQRDLSLVIGLR